MLIWFRIGQMKGFREHGREHSCFVHSGKFLDQMNHYQLSKNDCLLIFIKLFIYASLPRRCGLFYDTEYVTCHC